MTEPQQSFKEPPKGVNVIGLEPKPPQSFKEIPEGAILEPPKSFKEVPEGIKLEDDLSIDEIKQMQSEGVKLSEKLQRKLFEAEDERGLLDKAAGAASAFLPAAADIIGQTASGAVELANKAVVQPAAFALSGGYNRLDSEEAKKVFKDREEALRSVAVGAAKDVEETANAAVRAIYFGTGVTDKLLGKSKEERFRRWQDRQAMRDLEAKSLEETPDRAAYLLSQNPLIQGYIEYEAKKMGLSPEEVEKVKQDYIQTMLDQGLTKEQINQNIAALGEFVSPVAIPGGGRLSNAALKPLSKVTAPVINKASELAVRGTSKLAQGTEYAANKVLQGTELLQTGARKIGEYAINDPDTWIKGTVNTAIMPVVGVAKPVSATARVIRDITNIDVGGTAGRKGMVEMAGQRIDSSDLTKRLFGPQGKGGVARAKLADWTIRQSNALIQPGVNAAAMNVVMGLPDIETAEDLGFTAGTGFGIGSLAGVRSYDRLSGLVDPRKTMAEKITNFVTPDPAAYRRDEDADIKRFMAQATPDIQQNITDLADIEKRKAAVDATIASLEKERDAQINPEDAEFKQMQIDGFLKQKEALSKATPETQAEALRQTQLAFIDAYDLAQSTGGVAGLRGVKIAVLDPANAEQFFRDLYGDSLKQAETTINLLTGIPSLTETDSQKLTEARQLLQKFQNDVEGAKSTRGFAIQEDNTDPNSKDFVPPHLRRINQQGATAVINADLIKHLSSQGFNIRHTLQHEVQHAVQQFAEVNKMLAPLRGQLFDQKIRNDDETTEVYQQGIYSDEDLNRYAARYAKLMSPSDGGASFYAQFGGDSEKMRAYIKDEILAETAAATGEYAGGTRASLDDVGRNVMDWLEVKTKSGRLKQLKEALRRNGVIFDNVGAVSSVLDAQMSPETLAMVRQYQRGLKDFDGTMTVQQSRESDEPDIPLTKVLGSVALQNKYRHADFFEKEQIIKATAPDGSVTEIVIPKEAKIDPFIDVYRTQGGQLVDANGNVVTLGPEITFGSMPDGTTFEVDTRIARKSNGSPIILTNREMKSRALERTKMIQNAIDSAKDDGSGVRLSDTGNGNYRGVMSPAQIEAFMALPNNVVSPNLKRMTKFFNELMARNDGTRVVMEYQASLLNGKYKALSPKIRDEVPIGFQLTKDGNFALTTISVSRLYDKMQAWADKKPANLQPWNGDTGAFWDSVTKYLDNHAKGEKGETGLNPDAYIASKMKNKINDLFNAYNAETKQSNPERSTLPRARGKDNLDIVIRSRRLDRINNFSESPSQKLPINYGYLTTNYMPAVNPMAAPMTAEEVQNRFDGSVTATRVRRAMATGEIDALESELRQMDDLLPTESLQLVQGEGEMPRIQIVSMFDPENVASLEPEEIVSDIDAETEAELAILDAQDGTVPPQDIAKVLSSKLDQLYADGGRSPIIPALESELEKIYQQLESQAQEQEAATEDVVEAPETTEADIMNSPTDLIAQAVDNYNTGKVDNETQTLPEYIRSVVNEAGVLQIPSDVTDEQIAAAADDVVQYRESLKNRIQSGTEFSNAVVAPAGIQFLPAFHGSPYDFDEFRMDKIGSGEGAQAYGYGLYFAGAKRVAQGYREKLTRHDRVNGVQSGTLYKVDIDVNDEDLLDWDGSNLKNPDDWESGKINSLISKYLLGWQDIKSIDDFEYNLKIAEQGLAYGGETGLYNFAIDDARNNSNLQDVVDYWASVYVNSAATGEYIYSRMIEAIGTPQKASEYLLNSLGIKGIRYLDGMSRGEGEGTHNYVIFDENLIKILDKNDQPVGSITQFMPATIEAPSGERGFKSKLQMEIQRNFKGARATPEQLKSVLGNPQNVKPEEVKWSGVMDEIDRLAQENNGKVPVQELMNYLRNEGQVKFNEVTLGGVDRLTAPRSAERLRQVLTSNGFNPAEADRVVQAASRQENAYTGRNGGIIDLVQEVISDYRGLEEERNGTTKYAQYQLPGGENYREVILSMPSDLSRSQAKIDAINKRRKEILDTAKEQDLFNRSQTDPEAKALNDSLTAEFVELGKQADQLNADIRDGKTGEQFTSSHFPDVPNYIAHMRLNERETLKPIRSISEIENSILEAVPSAKSAQSLGSGAPISALNKGLITQEEADAYAEYRGYTGFGRSHKSPGLFIEEFQSDRHQQGREKGYASDIPTPFQYEDGWWGLPGWNTKFKTEEQAISEWKSSTEETKGIPDAPFRKDWGVQLFKRALRDAVESGKSWIGWTTGDTQAERYKLSKQVDSVVVILDGENTYALTAYKNGRSQVNEEKIPEAKLSEFIGKELANQAIGKIKSSEQPSLASAEFEGLDLDVGGEGMKGFYDQILPKEIGKYVAKMGGKVEKSEIETKKEYTIVGNPNFSSTMVFDTNQLASEMLANRGRNEGGKVIERKNISPIWRVNITPEMENVVRTGQTQFMPAEGDFEQIRRDAINKRNKRRNEAYEILYSVIPETADILKRKTNFEDDQQEFNSIPFSMPSVGFDYDRSFHLTKIVRRILDTLDPMADTRAIQNLRRKWDSASPMDKQGIEDRIKKYEDRIKKTASTMKYAFGVFADLTASLPEAKARDLRQDKIVDPWVVLKKHFPNGESKDINKVILELRDVIKFGTEKENFKNSINNVLNAAEVLRDFTDVDQSVIDQLFKDRYNKSEAQMKESEEEFLKEVTNPEFFDVEKTGSAIISQKIKPQGDIRFMPAENTASLSDLPAPEAQQSVEKPLSMVRLSDAPEPPKKYAFAYTTSSDRIPLVDALVKAKNWQAIRDLNQATIRHAMSDLPNVKYTLKDLVGAFENEREISVMPEFEITSPEELAEVRKRMVSLGELWQQTEVLEEQVGVGDQNLLGTVDTDGYLHIGKYVLTFDKLTPALVEKARKASGIQAMSYDNNSVIFYDTDNNPAEFKRRIIEFGTFITQNGRILERTEGDSTKVRSYRNPNSPKEGSLYYNEDPIRLFGEGQLPDRLRSPVYRIVSELLGRVLPPPKDGRASYFVKEDLTPKQVKLQNTIAKKQEAVVLNDKKNKDVIKAYEELNAELLKQFDALVAGGMTFTAAPDYPTYNSLYPDSASVIRDIRNNNNLVYLKTTPDTFGPIQNGKRLDFSFHPILKDSGRTDSSGNKMSYNDILRVVHDAIAHGIYSAQFGPIGEESAWHTHIRTIDNPWARWALTMETRAQNSWVNYQDKFLTEKKTGEDRMPLKKGDKGYIPASARDYAMQKFALIPLKYALTGDAKVDKPVKDLMEEIGEKRAEGSPEKEQEWMPSKKEREKIYASIKQPQGTPKDLLKQASDVIGKLTRKDDAENVPVIVEKAWVEKKSKDEDAEDATDDGVEDGEVITTSTAVLKDVVVYSLKGTPIVVRPLPNLLAENTKTKVSKNVLAIAEDKKKYLEYNNRVLTAADKLRQDPEMFTTPSGYLQFMRESGASGNLLMPPSQIAQLVKDPNAILQLWQGGYHGNKTAPGTVAAAVAGLDSVNAMRDLFIQDGVNLGPTRMITALHHLWGILSRQLDPYNQEALWMRMVSYAPVMEQIQLSIDGKFKLTVNEWKKIVQDARKATKGDYQKAGNNATSNANAFHHMLSKHNGKWQELANIYKLSDPVEMTNAFWGLGVGATGIKNKVQRFIGLTFGIHGSVLDRWRFVGLNLPTAMGLTGKATPETYFNYYGRNKTIPEDPVGIYKSYGTVENGNPVFSTALYAGIDRTIQGVIDNSKEMRDFLGVHATPGGFHWVDWNCVKNEAVGHSSLDLTKEFLKRKGRNGTVDDFLDVVRTSTTFTRADQDGRIIDLVMKDGIFQVVEQK